MLKIIIIEGWPIAAGAWLCDVTVLLRISSISEKNLWIFLVTSIGTPELRKKNCKFYFLELFADYEKILQFLQENVTIFNRKIVSFPLKIVKFCRKNRQIFLKNS